VERAAARVAAARCHATRSDCPMTTEAASMGPTLGRAMTGPPRVCVWARSAAATQVVVCWRSGWRRRRSARPVRRACRRPWARRWRPPSPRSPPPPPEPQQQRPPAAAPPDAPAPPEAAAPDDAPAPLDAPAPPEAPAPEDAAPPDAAPSWLPDDGALGAGAADGALPPPSPLPLLPVLPSSIFFGPSPDPVVGMGRGRFRAVLVSCSAPIWLYRSTPTKLRNR
jgi:hypothetical protein